MALIDANGAKPACVVICLDRQEKGKGELSAIQEVERDYGIPVISIVSLTQIMEFISEDGSLTQYSQAIEDYRQRYGIEN